MAVKGSVDTKIDTGALNEIIVYSNLFSKEVCDAVEQIQTICRRMEEEESLKGGDGEMIRESFIKISKGCMQIATSAKGISKTLDNRLGKALGMGKGSIAGNAAESAKSAADKAGVIRKE